jgi:elongation factor Ts
VLDTNESVGNALKKEGAEVLAMHRLAVGEGIDKPPPGDDFRTEVMKQAGLS